MLKPTIKLNKELWAKVKKCSEAGGYSSPEEFVAVIAADLVKWAKVVASAGIKAVQ